MIVVTVRVGVAMDRGRQGRPILSVAVVFNLSVGAEENADLEEVSVLHLGEIVLHGVKVFVILVGSNIPDRRLP